MAYPDSRRARPPIHTFYVNDTLITSDYPTTPDTVAPTPGSFVINQMFVHYRIPLQQRHQTPLVLVQGRGLTGVTYESTPDGREGSQSRIPTDEEIAPYKEVPDLEVFRDFVIDTPVSTGQPRYDARKACPDRDAAGDRAQREHAHADAGQEHPSHRQLAHWSTPVGLRRIFAP